MGAQIVVEHGYMIAKLPAGRTRLQGTRITTDMVTVTGTENFLMAASLAEGETVLENAAMEPSTNPTANWRWCRARPASKWWKPRVRADRKSTRLNSSHGAKSRMPSSA